MTAEPRTTDTLAAALPREMVRVTRLAAQYRTVEMGHIAAAIMEATVDVAQAALDEADTVAMIRCFAHLKEFEA